MCSGRKLNILQDSKRLDAFCLHVLYAWLLWEAGVKLYPENSGSLYLGEVFCLRTFDKYSFYSDITVLSWDNRAGDRGL